jgi:cytochrome c-type biogenesis protein CcmH
VSAADSLAPVRVALLAVVLLAPNASAQPAKEIEESLTCQCGCGLTVHTCNHLQCSFAVPVKRDVAESLANGQTANQILDRYVAEYGEKILSAPIPQGFNLAAYIAPYVAVAAGLGLIVVALRRLRRRSPAAATGAGHPLRTDAQRARLHRELEKLDS